MPWTLNATRAMHGKESDESFSILLSIEHPQLVVDGGEAGVLRLSLNEPGQDVYSNLTNDNGPQLVTAAKFTACIFDIELAHDIENAPTMRMTVENINRKIGKTLRSIREAASVYVGVILLDDPNTILTEYYAFKLRHASIDALNIEGELIQANMASEPYPFLRVTELRNPGLFK